ncbi:hypothetical protein [Microbacterium sp. HJ5]
MMQGLTGWHFVIIFYLLVLAVIGLALYLVVRLAVLHALKAHTKWKVQWQASAAGASGPAHPLNPVDPAGPDPLTET